MDGYKNKIKIMNYLAYYEIPESSGFCISNDIDKLKNEWCFAMRIFAVPDELTIDEFNKLEKPRFQKAKQIYKQIYKEGVLMHEND